MSNVTPTGLLPPKAILLLHSVIQARRGWFAVHLDFGGATITPRARVEEEGQGMQSGRVGFFWTMRTLQKKTMYHYT